MNAKETNTPKSVILTRKSALNSERITMKTRENSQEAFPTALGKKPSELRAWRCLGIGPKFYKPRGRALYDIADLDDFIRSGIRVSSVRASREERNVYLPTG